MKRARQNEACRLMISSSTYSAPYARALLAASSDSDLTWPRRRPPPPIVTHAGLAHMEQELKTAQENFKAVETGYGSDMMNLTIATRYVGTLLVRPTIMQFLEQNHLEMLREIRSILSATSMEVPQEEGANSDAGGPRASRARNRTSPRFVPSRGRKWQRMPRSKEDADAAR
jgi:hypothetical protein